MGLTHERWAGLSALIPSFARNLGRCPIGANLRTKVAIGGPEGRWKLAGGGAERNHRIRATNGHRPGGAAELRRIHRPCRGG